MARTALIDGDIIIYRAACNAQEDFEEETHDTGEWLIQEIRWAQKSKATCYAEKEIERICKNTKSQDCAIALTDRNGNFRKQINPSYKSNRHKKPKPLLYTFLRDYFKEAGYKVYNRPNLEGDDILGILATSDKIIKGDKVIWSIDKDFKTIPCKFRKEFPDGRHESKVITEEEADWWFMYQTLTGDTTDGYKGCPNIGDKKARQILGDVGDYTLDEMWLSVQMAYTQNGSTREKALLNARMARILRASDYDFKKKEVKLWTPN